MARTRSSDYDSIRVLIIEKAAAHFAQRGFAATSISDIAAACNCSKSRLYHYFKAKEDILIAMLREHVDVLLDMCRRTLERDANPMTRFRELVIAFVELYAVSRDKHVVLLTSLEFLSDENRREMIDKQRQLIGFVRNALAQIRPDLARAPRSAQVDVMLFFGMINWTYTWYSAHGPVRPGDFAERVVEVFLNGYRNAPALTASQPVP